jgi:hypothetical protein
MTEVRPNCATCGEPLVFATDLTLPKHLIPKGWHSRPNEHHQGQEWCGRCGCFRSTGPRTTSYLGHRVIVDE